VNGRDTGRASSRDIFSTFRKVCRCKDYSWFGLGSKLNCCYSSSLKLNRTVNGSSRIKPNWYIGSVHQFCGSNPELPLPITFPNWQKVNCAFSKRTYSLWTELYQIVIIRTVRKRPKTEPN
jgi:hypothetical protein